MGDAMKPGIRNVGKYARRRNTFLKIAHRREIRKHFRDSTFMQCCGSGMIYSGSFEFF